MLLMALAGKIICMNHMVINKFFIPHVYCSNPWTIPDYDQARFEMIHFVFYHNFLKITFIYPIRSYLIIIFYGKGGVSKSMALVILLLLSHDLRLGE